MARVSIIGMGKLGAPLAVLLAAKNHGVIGVDQNPDIVRTFANKKAPFYEPGLDDLLEKVTLDVTTDTYEAVDLTDVTMIVVPTPSRVDGSFSHTHVVAALHDISAAIRNKRSWHLVVIVSTVMPGAMDREIAPVLQEQTGKELGKGVSLCYSPEFIALGSVLDDLSCPDFVLIGEADERGGEYCRRLMQSLVENDAPVCQMSYLNAELTKLAVNCYLDVKIAYGNYLADLCERMRGADAHVITNAMGHDSRIGMTYIRPGGPPAGPCLPRDQKALGRLSRRLGLRSDLIDAAERVNNHIAVRLAKSIKCFGQERVAILGTAYKPGTWLTDKSLGTELKRELYRVAPDIMVVTYDPKAKADSQSLDEVIASADIVVITTPWPEFRTLKFEHQVVIDCWDVIAETRVSPAGRLIKLGVGE